MEVEELSRSITRNNRRIMDGVISGTFTRITKQSLTTARQRSFRITTTSMMSSSWDLPGSSCGQPINGGGPRWRSSASHVCDISTSTARRKTKRVYNGGMFWHTSHYADADTSTHRTYPRLAKNGGGGPSAEHNYTSGPVAASLSDRRCAIARRRRRTGGVGYTFRWTTAARRCFAGWTAGTRIRQLVRIVALSRSGPGAANSIRAMLDGIG